MTAAARLLGRLLAFVAAVAAVTVAGALVVLGSLWAAEVGGWPRLVAALAVTGAAGGYLYRTGDL